MIGDMQWTPREVRALRDAMEQSRMEFARKLQVDKRTIARWEDASGALALHAASRRLLGQALSSADPAVQARFRWLLSGAEPKASNVSNEIAIVDPGWLVAPGRTTPDSSVDGELRRWIDMNRRELIRLFGGVAGGLPAVAAMLAGLDVDQRARVADVLASPERVDAKAVDHIETALNIALAQNDVHGPHVVLAMVLAQKRIAAALLESCPPSLEQRLMNLYSSLSQLAGWMQFDLRDFGAARANYEDAREYAHKANNIDLAVPVLCNLSYLSIWRGNPRVGIDHAVAAQNWSARSTDHRLRAYSHDMAAIGYARDGQYGACMSALDTVDLELSAAAGQDVTSSVAYFEGAGLAASIRSDCMRHLGDGKRARAAAEDALNLIEGPFVRNRALAHLDLALALTDDGHIEDAADAIGKSARLAISCRSDRLVGQIQRTRHSLDPWVDSTAVRGLDDELASYGISVRT